MLQIRTETSRPGPVGNIAMPVPEKSSLYCPQCCSGMHETKHDCIEVLKRGLVASLENQQKLQQECSRLNAFCKVLEKEFVDQLLKLQSEHVRDRLQYQKEIASLRSALPPTELNRRQSRLQFDDLNLDVQLCRRHGSFGFSICGGFEDPSQPSGIIVSRIIEHGAAVGIIEVGDRLLKVGGVDVERASHEAVVDLFRLARDPVDVLVQRKRSRLRSTSTKEVQTDISSLPDSSTSEAPRDSAPAPTSASVREVLPSEQNQSSSAVTAAVAATAGCNPYDSAYDTLITSRSSDSGQSRKINRQPAADDENVRTASELSNSLVQLLCLDKNSSDSIRRTPSSTTTTFKMESNPAALTSVARTNNRASPGCGPPPFSDRKERSDEVKSRSNNVISSMSKLITETFGSLSRRPSRVTESRTLASSLDSGVSQDKDQPIVSEASEEIGHATVADKEQPLQTTEFKARMSKDGQRMYVKRVPHRKQRLQLREQKVTEQRAGLTTDDDAVTLYQGKYWSKKERRRQLARMRNHRQTTAQMGRSAPASGTAAADQDGLLKALRLRRGRQALLLDDFFSIEEILAQRTSDGCQLGTIQITTV